MYNTMAKGEKHNNVSSGLQNTRITRYDYNLTIMKSPKPATDTIYPHIKF
jgi:hypothetical protein